ncbi:MAG: SurA N-terminal domain-containing protein, partial [Halobacteriaceae archaeon]
MQVAGNNVTMTKLFSPGGRLLCSFNSNDPDYAQKSPAVLVNNQSISLAAVQNAIQQQPKKRRNARLAIQQLVNQELLRQKADKRNITVTDAQVRRAMQQSLNQSALNQLN